MSNRPKTLPSNAAVADVTPPPSEPPRASHLRLQEAPQGPLLLDAFASDRNGHAERQDDDDEHAADNAGRYQWCPVETERGGGDQKSQ